MSKLGNFFEIRGMKGASVRITKKHSVEWPFPPLISSKEVNAAFRAAQADEDVQIDSIPLALVADLREFCSGKIAKRRKLIPIGLYRAWIKKIQNKGLGYDIAITEYSSE